MFLISDKRERERKKERGWERKRERENVWLNRTSYWAHLTPRSLSLSLSPWSTSNAAQTKRLVEINFHNRNAKLLFLFTFLYWNLLPFESAVPHIELWIYILFNVLAIPLPLIQGVDWWGKKNQQKINTDTKIPKSPNPNLLIKV